MLGANSPSPLRRRAGQPLPPNDCGRSMLSRSLLRSGISQLSPTRLEGLKINLKSGLYIVSNRRGDHIPGSKRERGSLAGLHALGLPERKSIEQQLAVVFRAVPTTWVC